MSEKSLFYIKSFPTDFKLKTTDHEKTYTTQTIEGIFRKQKILPNTMSFWFDEKRLCTTILDDWYLQTYRPQWIIFQIVWDIKPDYVFPFDLNAITDNNIPVAEYYELVNEEAGNRLIKEYNHRLIDGFMQFIYESYHDLVADLKDGTWKVNPENVLKIVNDFRVSKWYSPLDDANKKLVTYNEAIFLRPIDVKIIALYWDINNPYYKQLSNKYSVPLYASVKEFYLNLKNSC